MCESTNLMLLSIQRKVSQHVHSNYIIAFDMILTINKHLCEDLATFKTGGLGISGFFKAMTKKCSSFFTAKSPVFYSMFYTRKLCCVRNARHIFWHRNHLVWKWRPLQILFCWFYFFLISASIFAIPLFFYMTTGVFWGGWWKGS